METSLLLLVFLYFNLCMAKNQDLQLLFFRCFYVKHCWRHLFSFFNIGWVFGGNFRENVVQILVGPALKPGSQLN